MRNWGRRAASVAAGVVTALTVTSCAVPFLVREPAPPSVSPGTPAASTAAPVPPTGSPDLARFYGQTLRWASCPGGECAKLTVPVDYADPGGATIEIALLRVAARTPGERVGSLVVNPGGPGGSGVEYARYADQIVGRDVRRQFDVVGFDPRGVGASAPLNCLPDADLDAFLGMDPTPDETGESQALLAGARKLAEGCQQGGGPLLAHVSTVEVARDLDVLRAALGEPQLHYLGKSYGTYLGATYADLFPAKVGRFVLDGVIAPDLTSTEVSEGQARGFELATRTYMDNCVKRGACPAGSSVEEGMQWLRDFLKGVDSQPLRVTDDQRVTTLTEGWASMGVAYAMYTPQEWPALTAALRDATKGDGNRLMELARKYAERTSTGRYTGNMMEAIYAVNCLDKPDTADLAVVQRNADAFAASAPTWGRLLAWGSVACGVWPVPAARAPKPVSAPVSTPIVLVGTTRDPATIYEWAVRLRRQLSNASLVTFDGDGHTAYTSSNSCVDRAVDGFLTRGTVPQDGLRC